VFQLHDNHTGEPSELRPNRPGELRLYLAVGAGAAADGDELRACLVADLVRRLAEHHHLRVSAWTSAAYPRAWDALNIYPLEVAAEAPQPLDVGIAPATTGPVPGAAPTPASSPPPEPAAARWLQPAPVFAATGLDGLSAGVDPLALRLASLDRHYRQPLELSEATLAASDAELRDWRAQVAQWANSPSRPMCTQYLQDFLTACDRDLDTAAALAALRILAADSTIPAGSKFETFAYLDRLAGLDLAREVGRA